MRGPSLSAVYKIQSEERLPDLERSVRRMHRQDVETVVLTDSEPVHEALRQNNHVARIQTTSRAGVTAARNEGAELATGDAVAFVDDDAYPSEEWADRIRAGFEAADAVGGPLHPDWRVDEPRWLPEAFYWLIGCGPFYDEPQFVPNTYASNFVVGRETFLAVGGFDSGVGVGSDGVQQGDEQDLARRLRNAGYDAVWYDPEAVMYHIIERQNVHRAGLLRRAYEQGRSKAYLGFDDRERGFIRDELSLGDSPGQAVASMAFTAAVGTGYLRGRVVG